MKKLAIITTHPIQYNAPLFALLAKRKNIYIKVFYTWGREVLKDKYDPGFGKVVEWDIPLLEGYEYEFAENVAADKGSHHFNGIINPGLVNAVSSWGADALLVYGWAFRGHLSLMKKMKGRLPVFFRGDSTLLDKQQLIKYWLRRAYLWNVYRHIDKALYTGQHNKAYFKWAGLKDKQLLFAPHVVDNDRFKPQQALHKEELRRAFQLPAGKFLFLFAGKLEPKKNPLLLLDAFLDMAAPGACLVMAGEGVLLQQLKDKSAGNNNIFFLPFQNQSKMPALYQLADCFVLPSQGPGETWGLAINEAMAAGIPVIASDKCGASPDMIDEGETGHIFPSNDKAALVSAMKRLMETATRGIDRSGFLQKKMERYSLEQLAQTIETVSSNPDQHC